MLRLFRLIMLIGVFVGGYYLGRMPNSPDLIAYAKNACHAASDASSEISAKAKADGTSIPQAAMAYFKERAAKKCTDQVQQEVPGMMNVNAGDNPATADPSKLR